VDLGAFLDGIVSVARVRCDTAGIGFASEVGHGVPGAIVVDDKRLRQVLLNLMDNAVKFTDAGRVALRVTRVTGEAPGACLRFEVEDTGCGIPPEHLAKVFEPFEQVGSLPLRRAGAGLGLAISQRLVRLMGGDIRVSSVPGHGSVFSFDIVVPELVHAAVRTEASVPAGYEGRVRSVLIADDVARNRVLLADILRPLGFEVHEAEDGEQSIAVARRVEPDLVLIDAVMPNLDGVGAIAAMRAMPALRDTPIVAISASAMAPDRDRCLAAGADVFIAKPIDVPSLLAEVRRLLDLRWTEFA
jgi:CheY-like chemotaxis protein